MLNLKLKPLSDEISKATKKNSENESAINSEPSVEFTNGFKTKISKKKKSKSEKSDKSSKKDKTSSKSSTSKSSKTDEPKNLSKADATNTNEKIEVDQPLPPPSKWEKDDFDEDKIEPDLEQNVLNKLKKATATLQNIKAAPVFIESLPNTCKYLN